MISKTSETEIKDLLKSIQKKYGYTLLEISQKVGVTEAIVSRWNNGKTEPSVRNLLKLKQLIESGETPQLRVKGEAQNMDGEIWKALVRIENTLSGLNERVTALEVKKKTVRGA